MNLSIEKVKKYFKKPFTRRAIGFYSGMSMSFAAALVFAGKETDQRGIIPSLVFNVGDLEVHLHHWLFSSLLLVLLIVPLFLKGKISPPLFPLCVWFFLWPYNSRSFFLLGLAQHNYKKISFGEFRFLRIYFLNI